MKTKILILIGLCLFAINMNAQVIDLESTTEGALLPRMTTADRTAISSPSESELVYDTDTQSFWYYKNSLWNELGSGGSASLYIENEVSQPDSVISSDLPPVMDTITLVSTEMITAETQVFVCVDISHTWVGDLDISLISPSSGATIELSNSNGGANENYKNTCFTNTATENITTGLAPFTGFYLPEESFSGLIGQPIGGDWTLQITDDETGDNGTLNSWEIIFTNSFALLAKTAYTAKSLEDFNQINLIAQNETAMQIDSFVRLGSWDSGYSGDSIQLLLSGKHNEGANIGIDGGYKLVIEGYDDDGPEDVYPLYAKNENSQVDFYLKSANTANSVNPLAYFRGDVAIGTETIADGYKLSVDGKIATEEILVEMSDDWPDYVFLDNYKLKSLSEVEAFIKNKGHLPNVPSAKEIELNGLQLGEMNKILMEKVEELTLYIIELEKKFNSLERNLNK